MNKHTAIRLAAWFDGEARPEEIPELEALIASDPEARAYLEELERTRKALREVEVPLVEEDAAWNSFRERLREADPVPSRPKVLAFPRYATAAAAILALGIGLWWPFRQAGQLPAEEGLESAVLLVETDLENATPVVYIDEPSGWTIVWVLEDVAPPEQG